MQKTAILSDTIDSLFSDEISSNLLSDLEQFVSDSIDALEARGVLPKNSRVDLEDLVNSAAEMIEGKKLSEEICTAVFQQRAEENAIVVDDSNDEEKVLPTHKKTHNVIGTLQQYVSGLDGHLVCQIEQILPDFSRQTRLEELRNLKDTSLTDCFISTQSTYFGHAFKKCR